MLNFCCHRWHVINGYADTTIKSMAKNPDYDPDLDDYGGDKVYKEKICLKCKKYVDEITPRYKFHLVQIRHRREMQEKAEALIARVKRGEKRIWER